MIYPVGEMIDRQTICSLKAEHNIPGARETYCWLDGNLQRYVQSGVITLDQLSDTRQRLLEVNRTQWQYEADLVQTTDLTAVGDFALRIRDSNNTRSATIQSVPTPSSADVHYPLEEFLDRFSIAKLYESRAGNGAPLFYTEAMQYLADSKLTLSDVEKYMERLYAVNAAIWDLEAAIRNGEEIELGEVGRRAIEIRKLNKQRNLTKNEVAKMTGGFQDTKQDHLAA